MAWIYTWKRHHIHTFEHDILFVHPIRFANIFLRNIFFIFSIAPSLLLSFFNFSPYISLEFFVLVLLWLFTLSTVAFTGYIASNVYRPLSGLIRSNNITLEKTKKMFVSFFFLCFYYYYFNFIFFFFHRLVGTCACCYDHNTNLIHVYSKQE